MKRAGEAPAPASTNRPRRPPRRRPVRDTGGLDKIIGTLRLVASYALVSTGFALGSFVFASALVASVYEWDEASGAYVNRFPNGSFYRRLSPTTFYPMLAAAAPPALVLGPRRRAGALRGVPAARVLLPGRGPGEADHGHPLGARSRGRGGRARGGADDDQ